MFFFSQIKADMMEAFSRSASEPPQSSSNQFGNQDGQSAPPTDLQSAQQEPSDSWKTRCAVCDYRGTTSLRRPSMSNNYNIILLVCMVMDNTIDVPQATELLWKISYFNVMICDKHFIYAVSTCFLSSSFFFVCFLIFAS